MPRGIPNSGKRSPRAGHTIDPYEFFDLYFNVYGMSKEKTLIAVGMYSKTKKEGTPYQKFADYKSNHKKEYEEARKEYLESIGVTQESMLTVVTDIANNGRYEKNRLDAAKYLLDYMDSHKDGNIENKMNKLIIEFQNSSPEDDNEG